MNGSLSASFWGDGGRFEATRPPVYDIGTHSKMLPEAGIPPPLIRGFLSSLVTPIFGSHSTAISKLDGPYTDLLSFLPAVFYSSTTKRCCMLSRSKPYLCGITGSINVGLNLTSLSCNH